MPLYKTLDSIQQLRKFSNDSDLSIEDRIPYAQYANDLSNKIGIDSTILNSERNIAFLHLISGDLQLHKTSHLKVLKLAHKLNDSIQIGISSNNLGWNYQVSETQNDSAYYYYHKAKKLFSVLNRKADESEVLLNMSIIQIHEHDFIGAEINLIRALSLTQDLTETNRILDSKWSLSNTLGEVYKSTKQYDKALKYYDKALAFNNKLTKASINENSGETYLRFQNYSYTQINIAECLKAQKKYNQAIAIYNRLFENKEIPIEDPLTYAAVLNNLAYVKYLNNDSDNEAILALYKQAYKISDSLDAQYEISAIGNDLSEFYISLDQKDSAIQYLERANKIARSTNINVEILRSLKLLAKVEDGESGKAHLYEYIQLKDSIIDRERNMRNKFAAIQFETDEIQSINKKITRDKKLLIITVIALLTSLVFIIISFSQRAKNKKLVFEREQQAANENIYGLMLDLKTKLEESRIQERNRISEELHDGILSKLFGSRLGLEYLFMKFKGDTNTSEKYRDYINAIQGVELEIRNVSHQLQDKAFTTRSDFKFIIKDYIKELSELHLFDYTIQFSDLIIWKDIDERLKVNLYRIIQESLQNAIKHAEAETIALNFSLQKNHLILTIVDDGVGFDLRKENNGIGLKNMKSRIHKLKGDFKLKTKLDKGTTTTVTIPLD